MLAVRLEPVPLMVMLLVQTRFGLEDVATTCRKSAEVSASPIVNGIEPAKPFIGIVMSLMSVMVGGLLPPVTVTVKTRTTVLFWPWPSLTVTVMVAVPLWPSAGVRFKERVLFGLK